MSLIVNSGIDVPPPKQEAATIESLQGGWFEQEIGLISETPSAGGATTHKHRD
jgi:hypothetical protein